MRAARPWPTGASTSRPQRPVGRAGGWEAYARRPPLSVRAQFRVHEHVRTNFHVAVRMCGSIAVGELRVIVHVELPHFAEVAGEGELILLDHTHAAHALVMR